MLEPKSELEKLIEGRLSGTNSPEEDRLLDRWMRSLDLSAQEEPTDEDVQLLKSRIDAIVKPTPTRSLSVRFRQIAAAAVLLFICSLSFFYFQYREVSSPSPEMTYTGPKPIISGEVDRLRVIYNYGEKDKAFLLSDGTTVTLTPNSSVRFVDGFYADKRHVALQGKGKFDVAKDSSRPFSVITGEVLTTALGTVFWVSQVAGHDEPVVSLLSGRVAISKRSESGADVLLATLNPGETWTKGGVQRAEKARPRPEVASGSLSRPVPLESLIFHHTPMVDVFATLSAHYHTKFLYEQQDVEGMTFYGNYEDHAELSDILRHISLTNELVIVYDETIGSYTVTRNEINASN